MLPKLSRYARRCARETILTLAWLAVMGIVADQIVSAFVSDKSILRPYECILAGGILVGVAAVYVYREVDWRRLIRRRVREVTRIRSGNISTQSNTAPSE